MNATAENLPPQAAPYEESGILRSSTELDKIFEALSAAQGEMTDPAKNKVATIASAKGNYGYKYSDLADLLQIVRPAFARHGLCLMQMPMNPRRGSVLIVTRVGHKSGQWIEGDLTMLVADDRPQTLGSAITYGRRYSAGAVAGISPDEDDDGQVAQNAGKKETSGGHRALSKDPPEAKGGWQSQKEDPAARQGGAMDAARRALEAGNPVPTVDVFDMKKSALQTRLCDLLKDKGVPDTLWEVVANEMQDKLMNSTNVQRAILTAKEKARQAAAAG